MAALVPDSSSSPDGLEDCQDEVRDLRAALVTRPVIEQAKGMLIANRGCSPDEAFQMLTDASQRSNRKLREVAKAMVDGAQSG